MSHLQHPPVKQEPWPKEEYDFDNIPSYPYPQTPHCPHAPNSYPITTYPKYGTEMEFQYSDCSSSNSISHSNGWSNPSPNQYPQYVLPSELTQSPLEETYISSSPTFPYAGQPQYDDYPLQPASTHSQTSGQTNSLPMDRSNSKYVSSMLDIDVKSNCRGYQWQE
jgi:hypothetical protein